MKKRALSVFVCVIALLCPSFVLGQFGMGCCPVGGAGAAGMSCVTVGNVSFVPWLGFGYQSLGLNVNFPFDGGLFRGLDVSLKNNALWIGSLGLDVAYGHRLRFYGVADTNLFVGNTGSLTTNTDSFWGGAGLPGTPISFNWSGTQPRWWELNLGGLYCLTDDVAILVGYKCDSLTENLDLGRDYLWALSETESLSGDFKVITRSPYIGLKICQSYFDFSLVWSPWLTSYDVNIPIRVFESVLGLGVVESYDNAWQLSGGGGQLLEAFAQTKFISGSILGMNLWLKGSWLQCKGNGNIDASQSVRGFTGYIGNGSGDAVFTRYLWALGISGQLMF